MASKGIKSLKDVREKLLGYRFDSVVRMASIDAERLAEIERGEPPTIAELESLARLYGIDAEILAEEPITLSVGDGVEVLTSLDEFRSVDDHTRARIVAAANAARDLVALYKRDNMDQDFRNQFKRQRPMLNEWQKEQFPYQQGAALARELRRRLDLGNRPISSVRDLVAASFPSITILYAEFGNEGPAGLSFVDSLRGPTIVLNLNGKNQNPYVRRLSLAHELCHLLVDWNGRQPVATISGYFNDSALDREQRANSFAVRFLCPPNVLPNFDADNADHREKLARYGLPYAAYRLHVKHERGQELPAIPPLELLPHGTGEQWQRAEEPIGVAGFPLPEVPPERRTQIARLAARLYSLGKLPRDEFAEMLQVTPAADLEQVLNYFVLDPPLTENLAAS